MASVKTLSPMVRDGVAVEVGTLLELKADEAQYLAGVNAVLIVDENDPVEQETADPKAKAK